MNRFVLLILAGLVSATASAADGGKAASVNSCQRLCSDSMRTNSAQYERCMIDCKAKAPDRKKLKSDPRIH